MTPSERGESSAMIRVLTNQRDRALRDWNLLGQKELYDATWGGWDTSCSRDPNKQWDTNRQIQNTAKLTATFSGSAISFYPIFSPKISSWNRSAWTTVTYQSGSLSTSDYSRSTKLASGWRRFWRRMGIHPDGRGE